LLAKPPTPTLLTDPFFSLRSLRSAHETLDSSSFRIAGLGSQLHHWRETQRYCGSCGTANLDKTEERAKFCPQCHYSSYPQLYPCIIVLVTRGRDLLLARSPHFQPGVYSTLAGFIEPGEAVENAVLREVREETQITTKNLRYLLSQPWPFPNSLMLGFIAEYDSGEIKIDGHEIEDAKWFTPEALPLLPSPLSISRWLIEKHLGTVQKNML
jgi:NAD+ diphosphatase